MRWYAKTFPVLLADVFWKYRLSESMYHAKAQGPLILDWDFVFE